MEDIDDDTVTRNTELEYNELQKRPWYYALTYDSFLPGRKLLDKNFSLRHVYMITFGSCISSGLLIASGFALGLGGPGNVLCGFMTIGILIYLTLQALAELCIMYPNNGSFSSYFSKFVHPAWGY
jgi:amino acid transporter